MYGTRLGGQLVGPGHPRKKSRLEKGHGQKKVGKHCCRGQEYAHSYKCKSFLHIFSLNSSPDFSSFSVSQKYSLPLSTLCLIQSTDVCLDSASNLLTHLLNFPTSHFSHSNPLPAFWNANLIHLGCSQRGSLLLKVFLCCLSCTNTTNIWFMVAA